jgi:hypothetical protein
MSIQRAIAIVSLAVACLTIPAADAQAPKSPPAAKPQGSVIHDFVMLKDGTSINGDVKTDSFTLKTKYGPLNLAKKDMLAVEYRKPPNKMEDEVQVSAGTRLAGDLQPAVLKIRVENLGELDIPKTEILAIMFQRPIEDLSEPTRKALGRGARGK